MSVCSARFVVNQFDFTAAVLLFQKTGTTTFVMAAV